MLNLSKVFRSANILSSSDLVSDVTTLEVPVSGHYLLQLGCDIINQSGVVWLSCNRQTGSLQLLLHQLSSDRKTPLKALRAVSLWYEGTETALMP